MKVLLVPFGLFLSTTILFAQDNLQPLKALPVTPSPTASALGKFGEIPVNMSTGIPEIGVPFYEYSDPAKGLQLKVGLSYHAGGHKIEDMAPNTGLGWSLNFGGIISRTMRGLPDDNSNGYINTSVLPYFQTTGFQPKTTYPSSAMPINEGICGLNDPNWVYMKQITEGYLDGECDLFNFSFPGFSGKFFFNKSGKIILENTSNLMVTPIFQYYQGFKKINSFEIITPEGVKYIFNEVESTEANPATGPNLPVVGEYVSSWYLKEIISKDFTDKILFTYQTGSNFIYESTFSYSIKSYFEYLPGITDLMQVTMPTQSGNFNYVETKNPKRIKEILLPDDVKVEFAYGLSRQDLNGDFALTGIAIKNGENSNEYELRYGYFNNYVGNQQEPGYVGVLYSENNQSVRLKLESIFRKSKVGEYKLYSFSYDPTPLPLRNSKKEDWWGYYTGGGDEQPNTALQMPGLDPNPGVYYLSDRPSSFIRTKAAVLNKIEYATGGYTEFSYELNNGYSILNFWQIGGLRIKEIKNYEPFNGLINAKRYKYIKEDGTSSGVLKIEPRFNRFWQVNYIFDFNPVVANDRRRYILNENWGPAESLSNYFGSPVLYSRVIEEEFSGQDLNGKSVSHFHTDMGSPMYGNTYPFSQGTQSSWAVGLLKKQEYYNKSNQVISSKTLDYDFFGALPLDSSNQTRNLILGTYFYDNKGTNLTVVYGSRSYQLFRGRVQLKKETEYLFTNNTEVGRIEKDFFYDSQNFLLKSTIQKNSKGELVEIKNYYPDDFNSVGLPEKYYFNLQNRKSDILLQEKWINKGGNQFLLGSIASKYALSGNALFLKEMHAIETNVPLPAANVGSQNPNILLRGNFYRTQKIVNSFDSRGRMVETKLNGNDKYVFYWGKKSETPVLVAKNAEIIDVAYTSFELDENFGWDGLNNQFIVKGNALFGNKYFQAEGFTFSKGQLNSAKKYYIRYWTSGFPLTVAGTLPGYPILSGTINNGGITWKQYVHIIGNVSNVSINGSGVVDELLLFPIESECVTYNLDVLRGLLSETDSRGNPKFYSYDPYGRLQHIKDNQGNILKQFCYNYAGQTINCNGQTFTNTQAYSGQFQKTGCTTGFVGSTVTYTVPIGTVTSIVSAADANILAQAKVNAEGQAYANANGTCTPSSSCTPSICQAQGQAYKCVAGVCEQGFQIFTGVEIMVNGVPHCEYYYEWSDLSRSYYSLPSGGSSCLMSF